MRENDCGMFSDGMKCVIRFVITSCVKRGDHTYTALGYNEPMFIISWWKWAKIDLNYCKNICR